MSLVSCHAKPNTVRQLLRATSSTPRTAIISTSTQNRPAITDLKCHQTRSYASPKGPRAPVRKPPPAPKPFRSGPSQIPDSSVLKVSLNAIFFARAQQRWHGAFNWRSPDEYFDYTDKYLKSLKNVDDAATVNFAEIGVPVEIAHEIGCLLFMEKEADAKGIASLMFISASAAGYDPSTITYARLLFRQDEWGKKRRFKPLEKRFMDIVSQGKDCNALAVYGEKLFMDNKFAAAAPILESALSVDDGIFEWRDMCLLYLAKSYARLGKVEEAKKTLKTLGDPDADAEVAPMLTTGGVVDKRQRLFSEGLRGREQAFRELAEIEFEKEARETDKDLKKEHHLWAMEWSKLADPNMKF
ncbi:uncharacterized protein B0J16DRAFT_105960 [Fusarium flagelliforme]|uniref:uncharacterized protein n=1 Tax=Fusarium flagelliforme TaxID=2675880 RepID=UPI001E8DB0CC|nr:uncharacterized protein B0J16DRAFT_105960 [Fusarium flagelliforme]KAH7189003.1 hypothetical protein B0J16DRAFT_105960 [Fusarium flagelliforme]